MNIAVVNASRYVSAEQLAAMVAALRVQLRDHFAPAWGLLTPHVVAASSPRRAPAGYAVIQLLDSSDVPDALGYHDEQGNRPYGQILCGVIIEAGGTVLGRAADPGAPSISATLSHEVLELLGDPACNAWATDAHGTDWAWEMCDAVQGDGYAVRADGHPAAVVSDFVTPAYFDPQTGPGERYDHLGVLGGPFTIAGGGYSITRKGGREVAVYGALVPEWLRVAKEQARARVGRRLGMRR